MHIIMCRYGIIITGYDIIISDCDFRMPGYVSLKSWYGNVMSKYFLSCQGITL